MLVSFEDVSKWRKSVDMEDYVQRFKENKINGRALYHLTERAAELLIPIIGDRMSFLSHLEELKSQDAGPSNAEPLNTGPSNASPSNRTERTSKSCRHSLAAKRRQRLARNKRKKEQQKQVKRGLSFMTNELKEENVSLKDKVKIEAVIKNKYFEMWRKSENEKDKLKHSRSVYLGNMQQQSKSCSSICNVLNIAHSLLEDAESENILGKGRFGTVQLKYCRSSLVAVKFFEPSSTAEMVKREASFLAYCCHINLPMLYGINNTEKPFFILTQFYGFNDNGLQAITLYTLIRGMTSVKVSHENWLHFVTQLSDVLCYIHAKEILHNGIKKDNVIVVNSPSGFLSPILIDFGKACNASEAKMKVLSSTEKSKYYKHHYHIAPKVIEGTHTQSVKSDVYSFGVVIAGIYDNIKYKPLKEIAKCCLGPYAKVKLSSTKVEFFL